ncbi:MAG: Hsp20/alpha crystallin family protein [Thermodesulfobacteriota bacterium]
MANEVARQQGQGFPQVRPAADILQKDDSYYILIDMPGVSKDKLDISVDENVLSVQADTAYQPQGQESLIENEFGNVQYVRKFTLSDNVDKENIQANLKNGLLRLHLPKSPETKPKRIEIQAG